MAVTHAEWFTAGDQLTNISFLPQESLLQRCLNDSVCRTPDSGSHVHEFKPHVWCKAHLKKKMKKKGRKEVGEGRRKEERKSSLNTPAHT